MVTKDLQRIIIAAVSQNGVIGHKNQIPWFSKEELRHFKATTFGFPIILGRITFDSIGKELKGRLNIIISANSKKNTNHEDKIYFSSVRKAYQYLRNNNYKKVFICGGSRVYKNVIKHCDEMIISHMNFSIDGESKFPNINLSLWKVIKEKSHKDFTVVHYVRRKMSD